MSCVFDDVVSAVGNISALQKALQARSRQAVHNWRSRGFPVAKCRQIEALTGISVRRLRPDDWRTYWPEAAKRRPKP